MDKAAIEKFIGYFKDAEIKSYDIRYSDANSTVSVGESAYVSLQDNDVITIVETNNNYAQKGPFNIKFIPYDTIYVVAATGLSVKETMKILSSAGIELDEDLKKLIESKGARITIKPSDGNVKFDENGDEIVEDLQYPRITK